MNNFIIKYGINYVNSIDVTEEILKKYLKENNILYIDTTLNFNNIKGDPYPNIKKKIIIIYNEYIRYFEENRSEHIIIDFNDIYNSFNINYGLNLDNSIDITNEVLNKNVFDDNVLHILKNTDLNNFNKDPYPYANKKIFINYNNISFEYNENLDNDIVIIFLNKDNTNKTLGFILLRHVNSNETNEYWKYSYNCIRQIYPENLIIIIDDNSDYNFITNIKMYKTSVIQSEYPKRGELLPYYYYSKNKFFDKAFIIHDSVFMNEYINTSYINSYKILWEFDPNNSLHQLGTNIKNIINVFEDDNKELYNFYETKLWSGCFGAMSIITYDFLNNINIKYDLSLLLNVILNRRDRECFERVIGCLLQKDLKIKSLYGCIYRYIQWGIKMKDIGKYNHLPIIKIWTGR